MITGVANYFLLSKMLGGDKDASSNAAEKPAIRKD